MLKPSIIGLLLYLLLQVALHGNADPLPGLPRTFFPNQAPAALPKNGIPVPAVLPVNGFPSPDAAALPLNGFPVPSMAKQDIPAAAAPPKLPTAPKIDGDDYGCLSLPMQLRQASDMVVMSATSMISSAQYTIQYEVINCLTAGYTTVGQLNQCIYQSATMGNIHSMLISTGQSINTFLQNFSENVRTMVQMCVPSLNEPPFVRANKTSASSSTKVSTRLACDSEAVRNCVVLALPQNLAPGNTAEYAQLAMERAFQSVWRLPDSVMKCFTAATQGEARQKLDGSSTFALPNDIEMQECVAELVEDSDAISNNLQQGLSTALQYSVKKVRRCFKNCQN